MSKVDIIIPNYNGVRFLSPCLDALAAQTCHDLRIIVVDDASTDDSVALIRERYPHVELIALAHNGGFVRAVNAGIRASNGEYVLLLNNDTIAESRMVEALVTTLERYPQYAIAAAKLLLFDQPNHLHTTGDGYGWDGVPFSRGVWQADHGQFDAIAEVFGACAGAALYRRAALMQLADNAGNVLDPFLTMYCEDVDLNLRARRAGFRTIFVPQARVLHHLSATGGGVLSSYYCGRNFILIWLKNLPLPILIKSAPQFLKAQAHVTFEAIKHIRGAAARARLRGQLAGIRDAWHVIKQRRFMPAETDNLNEWIGR